MSKNDLKERPDSEIMKSLLAELRFSALAFANELGYKSHSTIAHILNDRNNISDDLIDKIIKKFPTVSYWYLKKGKLPIIQENAKLVQSQANLFGTALPKDGIDYSLESFLTLKNIEKAINEQNELTRELIDLMKQKKADNQ
ncbi:hypothetical protein [Flavobacterium sp. FlaQc-50]|uniref:hypothetical protein n=1 Tax=unclassified Flavobacterium TaxID=196869 RepID=UPI0037575ABC